MSTFVTDAEGTVFHTNPTSSRGLNPISGCDQTLDLVAKGRDDGAQPWTMAWAPRHDAFPTSGRSPPDYANSIFDADPGGLTTADEGRLPARRGNSAPPGSARGRLQLRMRQRLA